MTEGIKLMFSLVSASTPFPRAGTLKDQKGLCLEHRKVMDQCLEITMLRTNMVFLDSLALLKLT